MSEVIQFPARAPKAVKAPGFSAIRRLIETYMPDPRPSAPTATENLVMRRAVALRGWTEQSLAQLGTEPTIELLEYWLDRAKAQRDSTPTGGDSNAE